MAGTARRVQDPLSFRVVAQVQGSLQAALAHVRALVGIELASAAESPLVIAAEGVMLSNGNFHVPALTVAIDAAAIAIAQSASLAAERVIRFMRRPTTRRRRTPQRTRARQRTAPQASALSTPACR